MSSVFERTSTTIDSPASTLEHSSNSVITCYCVFFLGFKATGARARAWEGRSLPETLCVTILVPTGASSVSVSLEEEITLRLPGFLVGRCDEAIAVNVEEISNGLKVVSGCWNPPLKIKELYGNFVCMEGKSKTQRNFLSMERI